MGTAESVLPEGPAAEALQEMVKPKRIGIGQNFWFELLKVQLPGLVKPGFFESHYSEPTVLDALVRDAYFLQLVATNEQSGNFRTFLRFWARLLHYFRTSPSDAKPCSFSAVLSLSLLCRCLLKQFSESMTASELLFQLEQVPVEAPKKEGHITVSYFEHHAEVAWCPSTPFSAALLVEPMCKLCPEDAYALERCRLRLATGEQVSVAEAAERLSELQQVVLCPCAVPHGKGSGVRSIFREVVDFMVYSTFGAVNTTSPSLHGAEDAVQRNLTMLPSTMRLQAILLEIIILLSAVSEGAEEEVGKRCCAPLNSLARQRRVAEQALRLRREAAEASGRGLEPKMPSPSAGAGEASEEHLPFLDAFAEVLLEDSGIEVQSNGANGKGAHVSSEGLIAQAFIATLLNNLWLEPYSALLPNPPREVLDLFSARPQDLEATAYRGIEASQLYMASGELMPGLPSGFVGDDGAAVEAGMAGKAVSRRALLVLLLLLFQDPQGKMTEAFAALSDPRYDMSGSAYAAITAPLHFPKLLRVTLQKLQEPGYPLLLYLLILRNPCFRNYCRSNAEKVLPAMLEVLNNVSDNKIQAKAPEAITAMVLSLLTLTSDHSFCAQMSSVKLMDGRTVLGAAQRSVREIPLSSLLIVVLLRLAHWNFAAGRDAFFNRALAALFGNLAAHGVQHMHQHCAKRIFEVANLLARNAVKLKAGSSLSGLAQAAEQHRARMVRSLLSSLLRLVSSCLRVPRVSSNSQLVYVLQKDYPTQFTQLEADPELGPPLMHVRTATDWFEAQCPGEDVDVEVQILRLAEAAARLPPELMTLASVASAAVSAYAETEAKAYFLPQVWEAAVKVMPDHVCWHSGKS